MLMCLTQLIQSIVFAYAYAYISWKEQERYTHKEYVNKEGKQKSICLWNMLYYWQQVLLLEKVLKLA